MATVPQMTPDEALRLLKTLQRIVRQIDNSTYQISYAMDIEDEAYLGQALEHMENARDVIFKRLTNLRQSAPTLVKSKRDMWEDGDE